MPTVRTGSQQFLQELNTNLVLQVIRQSQPTSQVEIVRRTNLSAGTVANITRQLRDSQLVEEMGPSASSGGRPRMLLRFNPSARFVVGVEFWAEETTLAVLDLAARIRTIATHPTRRGLGPEEAFRHVGARVNRLLDAQGLDRRKVLGVGISVDGMVDADRGVLKQSAHFNWADVAVRNLVEEATGLPCLVEASARAMAFGEYCYGAARSADGVLCIDVDAGIGAVSIFKGRIACGCHQMGGEIGHWVVVPDGPLCRCGRRGCLEAVASGTALVQQMRRQLEKGEKSALSPRALAGATRKAVRKIFDAAGDGDAAASDVVDRAGRHLGTAVAGLINFVDPDMVLLTGFVTHESRGALRDMVERSVRAGVLYGEAREVRIAQGALKENAALIGACAQVYEHTYRVPLQ